MTTGESSEIDELVNWELHLQAQLPIHYDSMVQHLRHFLCSNDTPVHFILQLFPLS